MRCVSEELQRVFRCVSRQLVKSWRASCCAVPLTLLFGAMMFSAASPAMADIIIAQYCVGCTGGGNPNQFPGQSVTTPSGSWTNVTFNFYDGVTGAPAASGSLYLFTQAYTGSGVNLASSASSSPGYVATATASGSVYVFNPSLTLSGNTQYFFYAGSLPSANGETFDFSNSYTGGQRYFSGNGGTLNFSGSSASDYAFNLSTSNPGPVPGGSLLSYIFLGVGGFALRFRRGAALAKNACRRICAWFGRFRPLTRKPASPPIASTRG